MSNGLRLRRRGQAHRRRLLAGLSLLALAIPAAALAAGDGQSARRVRLTCVTRHARSGFSSGPVRLFTLGKKPAEYQSEVTTRLVGCLKPRGPVYLLAYLSHKGDTVVGTVQAPRAAAPFAAFAIAASDEVAGKYGVLTPETVTVESINLRSGVALARVSSTEQPAQQSTTQPAVPNLQVTPAGAIAWLLSANTGETLYAFDSHGQRTLDAGNIDPKSLQIAGSTVTWTNAGTQRSATLS